MGKRLLVTRLGRLCQWRLYFKWWTIYSLFMNNWHGPVTETRSLKSLHQANYGKREINWKIREPLDPEMFHLKLANTYLPIARCTLQTYNRWVKREAFPKKWKQERPVLLRKGNKLLDNPSAYKPIFLLDVKGKLYVQLFLISLNEELQRTDGYRKGNMAFLRDGKLSMLLPKSPEQWEK